MEAYLVSTGVVALAEIGDKTQLLSLVLAARFKRPRPILTATLLNHALAGAVGAWVNALLGPDLMRWILGLSFIAMGVWMLIPDELKATDAPPVTRRLGIFGATFVAFFLVEMGDKTQIATVALAAVVLGTTLGLLLANVPVVLLGEAAARRLPIRAVHILAALVFAALGVSALAGFGAQGVGSGRGGWGVNPSHWC